MIGIDTNVLVRYLAQDDPRQSPAATAFIETLSSENPGFIGTVVLVETAWVMTHAYAASRARISEIIDELLQASEFRVQNAEIAHRALATYRSSVGDFADALIVQDALATGCKETVTFDRNAAKSLGMRRLD
jgi:predicted nucleic-acid-binding protein